MTKSKVTIEKDGNQYWKNEQGYLHREDGPAVIYSGGYEAWYHNDRLHREGGPAQIFPHGLQTWRINGEFHREDGPAVIDKNGRTEWYFAGDDITRKVDEWIKENNFPDYTLWTDAHKMMFRLTFSGK